MAGLGSIALALLCGPEQEPFTEAWTFSLESQLFARSQVQSLQHILMASTNWKP